MIGLSVTPDGARMFALHGDLDMTTAPILVKAIAPAVASGGPLLLDFADVSFIDSTAIHALIRASKSLGAECLVNHGAHGRASKALEVAGMAEVPHVHVVPCAQKGTAV